MNRVMALVVLFAASVAAPTSSTAEPLSGDAVKKLVGGKRVYLSTPYGVELPLQYRTNGSVRGDVSGISIASMFTPRETGKWWIAGNQLCQQWPTWYDGRKFCFTIEPRGENAISWQRDDGMTGTARIE